METEIEKKRKREKNECKRKTKRREQGELRTGRDEKRDRER